MKKISLPRFKELSTIGVAISGMFVSAQSALAQLDTIQITKQQGFAEDLGSVINFALSFVMGVALLLVFFYLIWGGIQWITSGGDKSKTEDARNKITAAVIGIIILAAAFALVQFVAWILGFTGINDAITGIDQLS